MSEILVSPVHDVHYYSFVGSDSRKFLNNFCTANLLTLQSEAAQELMILDAKGRVLAIGYAFLSENGIGLICFGQSTVSLVQHLDRYIIMDDVVLTKIDNVAFYFSYAKQSSDVEPVGERALLLGQFTSADFVGRPLAFETSLDGIFFMLSNDHDDASDQALEIAMKMFAGQASKSQAEVGTNEFQRRRVKARFPLVGQDTTEATLPQELQRDGLAISFNKGCYLGQETVARLDAMGHLNWCLSRVELDAELPDSMLNRSDAKLITPLQLIDDQQAIGQLTSVVGTDALARVRVSAKKATTAESKFLVAGQDGKSIQVTARLK